MDWKLLLGGALMAVLGGFIVFRFRKSNYNRELGAGCLMTAGMLMLLTGILASGISFMLRV
jgi:hypothetical protein